MSLITPSPELGALLLAIAFLYGARRLYGFLRIVHLTPLGALPGPPTPNLVYRNLREIAAVNDTLLPDAWFTLYRKTLIDREFFMVRHITTTARPSVAHTHQT